MKASLLSLAFLFLLPLAGMAADSPPVEMERETESAPAAGGALEELSKALITQTGTAISPVVGLSYLVLTNDPSVEKYKPAIWIVIALLGAVLLKDVGGTLVPGILKKPLDAVEFFQNQGLGVACASLLVPDLHAKLYAVVEMHVPVSQWAVGGVGPYFLAAIGSEGILHILTLPLSIAVFGAVWLLSNTINVLVLLSPFSLVDACLKSIKVIGLSVLAGLSSVHPYAGAALSLFIVIVALCFLGKAFRLYHFGCVFAWDLISRKHKRFQPAPDHVTAFLDQEIAEVPARTYGKLAAALDSDGCQFTYRRWLVFPAQTVIIPLERKPQVGQGLVHTTIEAMERDGDLDTYFHLPPRYRGHEMVVGESLRMEVIDVGVRRGVKRAVRWVKTALRKPRRVLSA